MIRAVELRWDAVQRFMEYQRYEKLRYLCTVTYGATASEHDEYHVLWERLFSPHGFWAVVSELENLNLSHREMERRLHSIAFSKGSVEAGGEWLCGYSPCRNGRTGVASHASTGAEPGEPTAPVPPEGAAAPAAGSDMPLGKIQVLSGPGAPKELELRKALTTLGRPGVQVAVIVRRPQGYFIAHVEGKHPVVNGESIGGQARALTAHDVIELAGVKMEFFVMS